MGSDQKETSQVPGRSCVRFINAELTNGSKSICFAMPRFTSVNTTRSFPGGRRGSLTATLADLTACDRC